MTDISLNFVNNNITVYSYEPFSYTISNPIGGSSTLSTTRTSGIPISYLTTDGNASVTFATTSNAMLPGTQQFTVSVTDASFIATSTNNVTIGAGRFVDASGNSLVGSRYTFYAKEAITPIKLVAPFTIGTPTSSPTLPPGLGFSTVDGNSVNIVGTPLVTAPQSNYLIIGKQVGSGKTVSSTIPIVISNERIQTNITGGGLVQGMLIGSNITPLTLTSKGNGTIRYTWAPFPDGIVVTDSSGNVQPYSTSGFTPMDPSFTMIIQGAPTLAAATAFKDASYSSVTQSILVERINPLPLISSLVPVVFAFGETVLFNTISNSTLYTNVPVSPTPATSYYAATYFTSNVDISSIFSPDLRSDLSLAFSGNLAYLTGTPTSAGTGTYTIRAVNSNSKFRDATTTIAVVDDFVTFSVPPPSAVDACYNFVLSRQVDLPLSGYYPSPIQYTAAAASGRSLTWSAPALAGTGLSLSTTTGNTTTIVGTPSNAIPTLQTLGVTASVSTASATRNALFNILNDVFTFTVSGALSFVQNKPITPVQFTATALSGRSVSSYSATGLPLGLSLSTTGRLSGTTLSGVGGSFTVNVSTGFTNGSQVFSYTIAPDSFLLFVSPPTSYPLTLGGPVPPARVNGVTYSGANVSNYVFSNLSPTYGLTIDSNTGVFGGTFTTSLPPQDILPPFVSFEVVGQVGLATGSLPVVINTINPPSYNWFTLAGFYVAKTTQGSFENWGAIGYTPTFTPTDYIVRPITLSSQLIVIVGGLAQYARSPDGFTFTTLEFPPHAYGQPGARKIIDVPNTSTLYGVGSYTYVNEYSEVTELASFFKSTNNGETWTTTFPIPLPGVPSPSWTTDLLANGNAVAYSSTHNTILLGGSGGGMFTPPTNVIYSRDGGDTWDAAGFLSPPVAVSAFSVEASPWVVVGSQYYIPGQQWNALSEAAYTIWVSFDQGTTWNAGVENVQNDFNYFGDFVVRGNGLWIAGGREGLYVPFDPETDSIINQVYIAFRYSINGTLWSTFSIPGVGNPIYSEYQVYPYADYIDSINYDGENYNIVIRTITFGEEGGSDDITSYKIFQHAADGSPLESGWEEVPNNLASVTDVYASQTTSALKGKFLIATPPIQPTLDFPSQALNGPTITSPTQFSYLLYQYVSIAPIQFSGIGSGTAYFFLLSEQLPPGLSFDQITNRITGTPAQTGQYTVLVYAQDFLGTGGITQFTLNFNVTLASYTRQQTSAGAWTSLIRQYTEVNAATTSRDNRATPAIDYRLGEFTSPDPPSVITAVNQCSSNC